MLYTVPVYESKYLKSYISYYWPFSLSILSLPDEGRF